MDRHRTGITTFARSGETRVIGFRASSLHKMAGAFVLAAITADSGHAQTGACVPDADGCWIGPWDFACAMTGSAPAPNCDFGEISHAALIPHGALQGMVLLWHRQCIAGAPTATTKAWIWNPAVPSSVWQIEQVLQSSIFCAGAAWDRDGLLVVAGGASSLAGPVPTETYRFFPGALATTDFGAESEPCLPGLIKSSPWRFVSDMGFGRFYPTVITLMKGVIAGGLVVESSTLVCGGSEKDSFGSGHPAGWPVDLWQVLPPRGSASGGWGLSLYPDGGGNQPAPAAPNEIYYRRASGTDPLPDPNLDSYPTLEQLSDRGQAPFRHVRDILVASQTNTIYPGDWRKSVAGDSYVIRLRYPGTANPVTEYWRGPRAATSSAGANRRHYGNVALMHMRSDNLPESDGLNRVFALNGAYNQTLTPTDPDVYSWAINPTVEEYKPDLDPAGGPGGAVWRTKSPGLQTPRLFANLVLLPTGEMLITGGTTTIDPALHPILGPTGEFAHRPEIFEPGAAGDFPSGGSTLMERSPNALGGTKPYARLYHNVALLLPDGRVFEAGGEKYDANGYTDGRYSAEVFSPPYLGYSFRPTIADISATEIDFSADFTVWVSQTQTDVQFTLLRPGVITHFFDPDQRYIELNRIDEGLDAGFHRYRVLAPAEDLGPPGYYMLFAVEKENGGPKKAPSVARFIRLK